MELPRVQLFTRDGLLIDTVVVSKMTGIVAWKGKYYAFLHGRYVETECTQGQDESPQTMIGIVTATTRHPWDEAASR